MAETTSPAETATAAEPVLATEPVPSETIATDKSARPGKAGRTDYDKWNKVTFDLVESVEKEEKDEIEQEKRALGLNGKYAVSEADAEERAKAKQVKKVKKALDRYQKREELMQQEFLELLGPTNDIDNNNNNNNNNKNIEESKSAEPKTVRITRNDMDAGKRVVAISDTSGASQTTDTIVLTQDLSLLESKMATNTQAKQYPDDAENQIKETSTPSEPRSIFGIIKAFISNVHNCTIIIKCKIITGAIEISHCSNLVIKVEKDATVATVQADLCKDIVLEFRDAPSGKNMATIPNKKIYWGEDKEDRIFHAGVSNMLVRIIRDGYVETERKCHYITDGAVDVGNATKEEHQFVTSVIDGELVTESVVRTGATTGTNARAMTQRELDAEKVKRDKAAEMAVNMAENMIQFKETGKEVTKNAVPPKTKKKETNTDNDNDDIEEVYSMSKEEIQLIVNECDTNKARGNEAFGTGEYAQAILLYSLALDKADELPDSSLVSDNTTTSSPKKQLFPRDVTLSNRAACFLKLGQHEKAKADADRAMSINPMNVKAIFRCGLALHAMGQYEQAMPILAKALKLEPNNKQIKQALQFAEVRFTQEQRKRMEG